jgi:hypothetical protein
MDIFERDKLPVAATVEQVCLLDGGSYTGPFFMAQT